MTVLAVAVGDLVRVVVVSLGAGVGVTVIFAVALVGAIRAREARRAGRTRARAGWGAVSALALVGVAASVLAGLWVVAG